MPAITKAVLIDRIIEAMDAGNDYAGESEKEAALIDIATKMAQAIHDYVVGRDVNVTTAPGTGTIKDDL